VAALRHALISGAVDAVATDHAPHAPELKDLPFDEAPPDAGPGARGPADLRGPGGPTCEPTQLFNLLSRAPARIAQLRAGDARLRLSGHGERLTLVTTRTWLSSIPSALDRASRRDAQSFDQYPYDGRAMLGRVRTTLARGQLIVDDGVLM